MDGCTYCNEIFHPAGMLDRDQRTAKIRHPSDAGADDTHHCDKVTVPRYHIVQLDDDGGRHQQRHRRHRQHQRPACSTTTSKRKGEEDAPPLTDGGGFHHHHHHQKTLSRILKVLTVGIYISLVEVPYTHSLPIPCPQDLNSALGDWWVDPNGYNSTTFAVADVNLVDAQSLRPVLITVNQSWQKVNETLTRNTALNSTVFGYKNQNYPWIGDPKTSLYRNRTKAQPDKLLLSAYEYLQRLAVGVDHGIAYSVVFSEDTLGNQKWAGILNGTHAQVKLLLSEIQMTLINMNVTVEENIGKDVIPKDLRQQLCNNTAVGIFNSIVYGHYYRFFGYFYEALKDIWIGH